MQSFTVKAPTRADLAGGTLDLWPIYCLVNGGAVINVGLSAYASAHFELTEHSQFSLELSGFGTDPVILEKPLTVEEQASLPKALQFPAAMVSRYLERHYSLPNQFIKLKVGAQAPPKSGLGGSSSLAVAITTGLARVFGEFSEQGWQWQMMEWVRDAEASFLRTATGTQDYLGALFGGLRSYRYSLGSVTEVQLPDAVFSELNERAIILYSGEMHESGLSNWQVFKAALEGNQKVLGGFAAIKRIADELEGELSRGSIDWEVVGSLLTQEWDQRRETFQVQTKRLDEIVDWLSNQDILGSKVCGAAAGGSLLVLTEPKKRVDFIHACRNENIQVLDLECTKLGVEIAPGKLELS